MLFYFSDVVFLFYSKAGETPLFLATTSYVTEPKYVEVVRELLEDGADVNAANKVDFVALYVN